MLLPTPSHALMLGPVASHFTNRYGRRLIPLAGHLLSRERPHAIVDAIRALA